MPLNPYEPPHLPESSEEIVDTDSGGDAAVVAPATLTTAEYYRPPKLLLAHAYAWLVLVLVCATILYSTGSFSSFPSNILVNVIHKTLVVVSCVCISAGILGTIVILRDKLRGIRGRLQPGHWLLVILSTMFLMRLLMSLARLLLYGPPKVIVATTSGSYNPPSFVDFLPGITVGLATAVAFLWLMIKLREGWPWRMLAAALTIMIAILPLQTLDLAWQLSGSSRLSDCHLEHWFFAIERASIVVLLALVVAVLVDLAQHHQRDRLHWLGVALAAWVGINMFHGRIIMLAANWG